MTIALSSKLTSKLTTYGLTLGSNSARSRQLTSSCSSLNIFLDDGLAFGAISEWGLPIGRDGRRLILTFLAHRDQTSAYKTLWIYPEHNSTVYPPAWQAQGVDLHHVVFAQCSDPVKRLRPVFLESLFSIIVIDAPSQCNSDDLAFLAIRARANQQVIFLLRPYFLTPERGNVFAKTRLNAWYEKDLQCYQLQAIRGLSRRRQTITLEGTYER